MQSVSSKIWTRVAVSISYDDNHYTTGTSLGRVYESPYPPGYGLNIPLLFFLKDVFGIK